MAKENVFLLILLLSIIPGMAFGTPAIKTTQRMIVIDPGHGGTHSGLISSGGLEEKTIALKLAQKTAQTLETRYSVILTRTSDVNMPLQERMSTANRNHADLFLSLHLNDSNQPSGYFFYFALPEPDISLPHAIDNSWKSQPLRHQAEAKQVADSFLTIFSTHQPSARFFINSGPILVLEGATMPAILIEPLSISMLAQHPKEIETILDEYAIRILQSIDHYFKKKTNPPF